MNLNIIYKKCSLIILVTLLLTISGCSKFVDVPSPIDQIPSDIAFGSDTKAASAVRALYGIMVGSTGVLTTTLGYSGAVQISMGVSADELMNTSVTNTFNDFYTNSIVAANGTSSSNIWGCLYNLIFNANSIIENVEKSTGITAAGKKQFLAEAKFIRAANYFYLINLYGNVPMPLGSDYKTNANLPKVDKNVIYDLIVDDLKYAVANLGPAYLGTQRLRANKYAASALLARVYLYREDWVNAEIQASEVIDVAGKTVYDMETDLKKTFLTSSKEVILQLQQPGTNLYAWDGYNFVPSVATNAPQYQITDKLFQSFETGDLRKTDWIKTVTLTIGGVTKNYSYPYKYKINSGTGTTRTESNVFLRLSEVYLIRAEARTHQNKLGTAISDLDIIRKRSGIGLISVTKPSATQSELLELIAHERFVELFIEHGHRWMDLKRTGKADEVLKDKPNWRPEAKLYPIPLDDINKNPFLKQNEGYN